MRRKRSAVTILDVAKAAGVSVSTVSRVLNGKVDVAVDTQEKVQDIIDQLGYTTNLAARSMRGSKTNLIGLIMPDVAYPFAIEVMKGVNEAVAASESDLLIYTTGDVRKYETALHQQKYVTLLNNSITDGVIVVAPVAAEFTTDAPLVSIDPAMIDPSYPSIHATNYQGALDAMHYLLQLGHRRIGHISGRPELQSSVRRLMGYRAALDQAGVAIDESLIAAGDYTTETAARCARSLLERVDRPTAIFAANDQSAIGVIQVANKMGLKIPDDLSVVGFDNIPEAAYFDLTTVDQFVAKMAFTATKMLFSLIDGQKLEEKIAKMPTKLIVRGSCREFSAAV
ncbi:MAG: LacI family transcriptional regulator [Caldilineales bacterium]|nr:LacI family transcriptional regulator [Caldilineales bacterium]MCW5858785.1 LacI family DNA-binding transcriptional regulator [Caldilineales bacterium]